MSAEFEFARLDAATQEFLLKIAPMVPQFFKMALTKRCPTCGEVKTVAHFNRRLNKSSGKTPSFVSRCKDCVAVESRKKHASWRRRNPEKFNALRNRDHAIKSLLYGTNLKRSDLPVELIELAATRLKVIQQIKRVANQQIREETNENR